MTNEITESTSTAHDRKSGLTGKNKNMVLKDWTMDTDSLFLLQVYDLIIFGMRVVIFLHISRQNTVANCKYPNIAKLSFHESWPMKGRPRYRIVYRGLPLVRKRALSYNNEKI